MRPPLDPRDNALFLVNWHERMRPSSVVAAASISAVVLVLVLTGCRSAARDSHRPELWPGWALGYVAGFQAVVLLLAGSYSVGQAAARERSGGTLDFHRTSPTPRLDQVLGLVLGASSIEWCVFAGTFPFSLALALASTVRMATFAGFYASLVLSALFFHCLAAALGLWSGGRKSLGRGNAVGALPPVVLFAFSGVAIATKTSALFHSTSLPFFVRLVGEASGLKSALVQGGAAMELWPGELASFYGFGLPSLMLQALVQVPFAAMAVLSAVRLVSNPERPALSKTQALGVVALYFFLYAGSVHGASGGPLPGLLFSAVYLGLWGVWSVTPGHIAFLRGVRRASRLGRSHAGLVDDHASNLIWLAAYAAVVGACLLVLAPGERATPAAKIAGAFVVAMSYVAFFAGAVEYHRLGPYRTWKGMFAVAISVLWVFLPAMAGLVSIGTRGGADWVAAFCAPSPFVGLPMLIDALAGGMPDWYLPTAAILNAALAGATLVLAAMERSRCVEESLRAPGASGVACREAAGGRWP